MIETLLAKGASLLLGGGAKKATGAIKDIAGAIDTFIETADEKTTAQQFKDTLKVRLMEMQVQVNLLEAGHRSLFVSGWRPAVGWTCVFALNWCWWLGKFVSSVLLQFGMNFPAPDQITTGQVVGLITALLGLGILRTGEKSRGLSR